MLKSLAYDRSYYEEHRDAGMDFLAFGEWQISYGRWLIDCLGLRDKTVLDIGCACGSLMRGMGEAGAIVRGIDISEYMIGLSRSRWPDMAELVHVCDVANLHLFDDSSWDAIHCAQVAEHWRPNLVPSILGEIARVTKSGGLFFCSLDTEELYQRQNRNPANEDPTHACIRPLFWWHSQLEEAGWEPDHTAIVDGMGLDLYNLTNHPESFLKKYDWDWFVARKK